MQKNAIKFGKTNFGNTIISELTSVRIPNGENENPTDDDFSDNDSTGERPKVENVRVEIIWNTSLGPSGHNEIKGTRYDSKTQRITVAESITITVKEHDNYMILAHELYEVCDSLRGQNEKGIKELGVRMFEVIMCEVDDSLNPTTQDKTFNNAMNALLEEIVAKGWDMSKVDVGIWNNAKTALEELKNSNYTDIGNDPTKFDTSLLRLVYEDCYGSRSVDSEGTGSEGTGSDGTGSDGTGSDGMDSDGAGSDGISSDGCGGECDCPKCKCKNKK